MESVLLNFRQKFLSALNSLSNWLSKSPEKKTSSTRQNQPSQRKKTTNAVYKNLKDDKISSKNYSHKGSSYKGKGNVNTDAAVFNKLRKDEPRGGVH